MGTGGTTVADADETTTDVETTAAVTTADTTAPPTTGADGSSSGGEPPPPLDCMEIPPGPFVPMEQFTPAVFDGSEDIAFNGLGQLAGRNGDDIVLVDASGAEVNRYTDPGGSWGTRYRADGELLVAHHSVGSIRQISPEGVVADFALGHPLVNGLYPDLEGTVWITNFSSVGRFDAAGAYEEIITGEDAQSANGIVFDETRRLLFFTNYEQGRIRKAVIGADGSVGAISDVGEVPGAFFDGLALDACGYLYAVDNGGGVVYRMILHESGEALAQPMNITSGAMMNVANAQFGRGPGFDETSLYVAGMGGIVYRMDVGVPGAEIPLP